MAGISVCFWVERTECCKERKGGGGGEERKMKMEDAGDEVEVVLMNLDLIIAYKLEVGSAKWELQLMLLSVRSTLHT